MDWTELANKHRRGDGLPKMIREPSPSDARPVITLCLSSTRSIRKFWMSSTVAVYSRHGFLCSFFSSDFSFFFIGSQNLHTKLQNIQGLCK